LTSDPLVDVLALSLWVFLEIDDLERRAVEFLYQIAECIPKVITVLREQPVCNRERDWLAFQTVENDREISDDDDAPLSQTLRDRPMFFRLCS